MNDTATSKPLLAEYVPTEVPHSYSHLMFQSDSRQQAQMFFIDGKVPQVGDEVKLIVTRSELIEADIYRKESYCIEINIQVV